MNRNCGTRDALEYCMVKIVRWIRDNEIPVALRITVLLAPLIGLIIHIPVLFLCVSLPAIIRERTEKIASSIFGIILADFRFKFGGFI